MNERSQAQTSFTQVPEQRLMVIEVGIVVTSGARGGMIGKGPKGAFWCARDVLYFDLGGSFANLFIHKTYLGCACKNCVLHCIMLGLD